MYFNTTMDAKAGGDLRRAGAVRAEGGRWLAFRKLCVVLASALVAINIWIGSPLVALWVGSQVQRGMGHLSMTAVFTVVVVLGVLVLALTWTLARLNARYDELIGRSPEQREPLPWLRSMRGERESEARTRVGISAVERIVVLTVVAAVLAFEIWFFFLAGSSLPSS
jgi:hypothetical protein